MSALTMAQFRALWAGFKQKGAWYGKHNATGGAYRRMCLRMVEQKWLNDRPPYAITHKGMKVLRDACHDRWAKSGCISHQQDLAEVEKALAAPEMRPYQRETMTAITRPTTPTVEALRVSSGLIAAAAIETNPVEHASMFISRFCQTIGKPVSRENLAFFIDLISRMTDDNFDDLDLIRLYLRNE